MNIDVLRRKNLFIFMSSLDITEDDISILKPVQDTILKRKENYTIVWVPIVDKWTGELVTKYSTLRSQMPWYSVDVQSDSSPIAGLRFIKEEWQFKGQPTLVLMNPLGKVENANAFHLLRVWGLEAFPYNEEAQEIVSAKINWLGPIVKTIHPTIENWVQ